MTAWVAAGACPTPPARVLDLGCGIGSVLMLLAWRFPAARLVGVEAQATSVELARRSLVWNGADARADVRCGDLRDAALVADGAVFDLVTGTPPYLVPGEATESGRVQCGPCRFTRRGTIADYCTAAARLLAPGGRFVVCEAAGRDERAARAAAAAGLAREARLDVVPRAGKAPLFAVHVLRRAAADAPALRVRRLIVRDAIGARTATFRRLRADMGMPP